MTNEPKIIYLQIGDDVDIKDFKESDFETNGITWCWERIFDNDIEYISKSKLLGLVDDMIKKDESLSMIFDEDAKWAKGQFGEHNSKVKAFLTELKQEIEKL